MIQIWYPAARVTGRLRAPWMTPAAARHFQSSGLLPTGYVTLPDSHAGPDAPALTAGGRRPVILYSHGHGQHRSSSLSLVEDLASHGYVVVTIDHTYDAGQVEFPGGRVETYGMPELSPDLPPAEEARIVGKAVRVRVDDVRYTLKELRRAVRHETPGFPVGLRDIMDLSRTAMFGHSLGGATTAEAMCAGLPITAGVNLDGALFGEVVTRGVDRPLLLVGADQPDDTTWLDTWPHLRGWRRFMRLAGSEHFSFTDYEALLPQAAARSARPRNNSPPSSARCSGAARCPCSGKSSRSSSACTYAATAHLSLTGPPRATRNSSSGRTPVRHRTAVNRTHRPI